MTNILQFRHKPQTPPEPPTKPAPARMAFAVEEVFRAAHVYRVILEDPESSEELLEIAVDSVRRGEDFVWMEGEVLARHFDVMAIGESEKAKGLLTRFYEWRYRG